MYAIEAIHTWIIGHPISFALFLAFGVGVPSSIYAPEIRQFLRLPPQHLNVWLRKSFIAGYEARLVQIGSLRNNLPLGLAFAVSAILTALLAVGTPLTVLAAITVKTLYQGPLAPRMLIPAEVFATGVCIWGSSLSIRIVLLLSDAASPERSVPKLEAKLNQLRTRSCMKKSQTRS